MLLKVADFVILISYEYNNDRMMQLIDGTNKGAKKFLRYLAKDQKIGAIVLNAQSIYYLVRQAFRKVCTGKRLHTFTILSYKMVQFSRYRGAEVYSF